METKVKYLVDTNIWLERLLDQEKSEIVAQFLDQIPLENLFVSDFTIHSIGVILTRLKKLDVLGKFLFDLFVNGQIKQLTLNAGDLLNVIDNSQRFKLDFDDAYQLSISQKYDLIIISFDKDFNAEGIRKNMPEEIISKDEMPDWEPLV